MKIRKKMQQLGGLGLMLLLLNACEHLGPQTKKREILQPTGINIDAGDAEAQGNTGPANNISASSLPKAEFYPGSNAPFDRRLTRSGNSRNTSGGAYSLNFEDTDLAEVIKVILLDILHENYLVAPEVNGTVTIQTSKPLSKEELLPTLEILLRMNSAALNKRGNHYFIEPMARASEGSVFNSHDPDLPDGYQVRVMPIINVDAKNLSEILKPLVYEKTIVYVDDMRNLLLVAGTRSELDRIQDIVASFDVDVLKGRSFALYPISHVAPEEIIKELEIIFANKDSGKNGHLQFLSIERLNAVMAITHQTKYLIDVEQWIVRLDRANSTSGGGVTVYKAQHVDAVKLAETLNEIFRPGQKKKNQANVAPGLKPAEISNARPNAPVNPVVGAAIRSDISNIGEVRIIADELNNSLVIVANAQDYAVIRSVITQLDVMPLQVLIDATIISVTLTDDLQYGIKWYFEHNGGKSIATSAGATGTAGAVIRGFGQLAADAAANFASGFTYSFVPTAGKLRAELDALASKDKIDVIASPSLMVLNNQNASIQVGDEVPVRASESTNTSGGGTNPIQTSSIQMRETGVSLNVKPRVNANGLVIMDIEQSVDKAIPSDTSTIDSPTIQQRKVKSQVAVQSGETIVLGGLIDESNTRSTDGVPFFNELPLIGPLFGSTGKTLTRTELVILITPRVVKSRQDARLITDEFKRKLTGIYNEPEQVEQNESQDADESGV